MRERCESKLHAEGSTYLCEFDAGHGGPHEHGDWSWHDEASAPELSQDGKEGLDADPQPRETGWLIERGGLCFGFCERKPKWVTFTNDQALRFARRSDAIRFIEAFRKQLDLEDVLVTEHLWGCGIVSLHRTRKHRYL